MHMLVHDPIRSDDDIGEYLFTKKDTHHASRHSGEERIPQILARDGMPLVPERFEGTDQSPLLLHHTGHGRQADQRCYKEEDHREHFPDGSHPVRVFAIPCIIGKIAPVIHIPFRFLQVLYLFLRIRELLLCFLDLLFTIRDLRLGFRLALIVFFPSVCQLLLFGRNLRFCFGKLLLPSFQLCPSAVDLLLGRDKLCLRGIDLGLRLCDSRLPTLDLRVQRLERRHRHIVSLAACCQRIVLLFCRIELIDLGVQRLNIRVQLRSALIHFCLAVVQLLPVRFDLGPGCLQLALPAVQLCLRILELRPSVRQLCFCFRPAFL